MVDPKDVTILIVDDEEALRKAIMFDFKRRGFNVLDAGSGSEAFEIIRKNKIHVVLSDVRMPNGDGVDLLDRVKEQNPEIPVVMFITGFADLTLEDAFAKGADAVFSKPFDRKRIMETVINAVKAKEEVWSPRKEQRFDTDFDIRLQYQGIEDAISGRVMNIGRGGFFVAYDGGLPNPGSKVTFQIQFDQGVPQALEGAGVVRWIRMHETPGFPKGCGIEFEELSDQSRAQVIDFINSHKPKAFIPKS